MPIPDHIHPIYGVREWRIMDGALFSLVQDHPWSVGVNHSQCETGHSRPDPECECGLYAYSDSGITAAYWKLHRWLARHERGNCPDGIWVMGIIEAWGTLEQYETGFRAQYARIVSLAQGDDEDQLNAAEHGAATTVARCYGVPLLRRIPQLVSSG